MKVSTPGPDAARPAHSDTGPTSQLPPSLLPIVSVVIPCRNRSNMLRDCFRGLAAQTIGLGVFEVVLIDNCSTEDLSIVAAEARAMGLDVRMQRTQQDRGPAPARNLGVSIARAPIIAFTDSDCRAAPDWLANALRRLDDPGITFVCGPVLAKPEQKVTPTTRLGCVTEVEHPSFPTANLIIRRDDFLAHGGFDTTLSYVDPWDRTTECADTDLAWRVLKSGHRRVFAPDVIIYHEQETLTLLRFWFDPSRTFVVPELVRRHPELRKELLTLNLFFYPAAAALYVAIPATVALAIWAPMWLWLLLVPLVARGILRTRSLSPIRVGKAVGRQFFHLPRMLITCATMIYGSVRFRCLVL